MKNVIAILVIVLCGVGLFSSCIHCSRSSDDKDLKVLKQVRVAVKTANLRTGPGTSYDYATVKSDGSGGKWQVKRGTLLDVIAQKKGWYQVRVAGNERTAYIKQTLCKELTPSGNSSRKSAKNGTEETKSKDVRDKKPKKASSPSVPSDDEVVEEITSGQPQDDEIFF